MAFQKAEKRKSKLFLMLEGMSSSGKTLGALLIAKGMGLKTAVIDSEAGRSNIHASNPLLNGFSYDVQVLVAPYTPEKYIAALKEAEQAGYELVIVDSASHEWLTILEVKSNLDEKPNTNQWTNWNQPTKRHNSFIESLIQSPLHKIITSRVKREYALVENDKGKLVPQLMGLSNVQRDGIEYEASLELRIDQNHQAVAIKDNTGIFLDQGAFQITEATGADLKKWLEDGKEPDPKCERCGKQEPLTKADNGKSYCQTCFKEYEEYKKSKQP